jgi:hypothetical protein
MAKKTLPKWKDVLGQEYGPVDIVSIATVSGRSPQAVVGEVVSINATNNDGDPYYQRGNGPAELSRYAINGQFRIPDYHKETVTITVLPLCDARGFYRSGKQTTYKIAANIIKLNVNSEEIKNRFKTVDDEV